MSVATLTSRGQLVIPADIRRRYALTPGTQIEFVDDGDKIALRVKRSVQPTNIDDGYGLIQVDPNRKAAGNLEDFDPAQLARP